MGNSRYKFRAWDFDNLAMYHSGRDEENGEGMVNWRIDTNGIAFEELQLINSNPGGRGHVQSLEYRTPKQVLMQYTGLKDRNGVEIYEGDLVQNESGRICKVEYREVMAGFDFTPVSNTRFTNANGFNPWGAHLYLEIVGNVFQHPDLLAEPVNGSSVGEISDTATASKK